MPLGEIAGEIVGGLFRFLAQFFVEIVLEILIKGPGYIICRQFSKNVNPDRLTVVFVGFMFWVVIGGCGYAMYKFLLA